MVMVEAAEVDSAEVLEAALPAEAEQADKNSKRSAGSFFCIRMLHCQS